jgi:IS30 family transposase
MVSHRHFTRHERVQIQTLLRAGHTQAAIAAQLGFNPSSVSRELKRGASPAVTTGYSVRQAQHHADSARSSANQQHRKLFSGSALSLYICICLAKCWSPEQIAIYLARFRRRIAVSLHTIYRWIWSHSKQGVALLRPYLRHPERRRKYGTKRREQQRELTKKRWIEQRPAGATNRSRYGHWEGDTVCGAKNTGRLVTLVERKSGYLLAAFVPNGSMDSFRDAAVALLMTLPTQLRHTLTLDNGREMNEFEAIERRTGVAVYFAHPYHSWERGTNENTNGLLRQFFPKGSVFTGTTKQQVDRAVTLLNTRPRKRLNAETPEQRLRKLGIAI